jgi:uncharacterized protein involved in exopolysaccharide biosynthesis
MSTFQRESPSGDTFARLVRSAWRYKGLIVALVLLGALLGYGWSSRQPVQYEGVVKIFVDAGGDLADVDQIVRSQAEYLTSPVVIDRSVALTGGRLTRKELEKRLTVEPARDANVITVRVLDDTPERAANLADTVVRAYRTVVAEQTTAGAREQIVLIGKRQARINTQIATLNERLLADPGNPVLTASINAKNKELANLADQAEEAGRAADRATSRLETLRDNATAPDEPAQPKPLWNAVVGGLLGLLVSAVLVWWRTRRHGPPPRSSSTPELPSPA